MGPAPTPSLTGDPAGAFHRETVLGEGWQADCGAGLLSMQGHRNPTSGLEEALSFMF